MKYFLLLCTIFIITLSNTATLPPYINKCKLNSTTEERSQCIIKSAKEVIQRLASKEGIPELNLPPIEPFKLDEFAFHTGNQSANDEIDLNLSNILVKGLKDIQINNLLFDLKENVIEFSFRIPVLKAQTDFKFKGRILIFDLDHSGSANMNILAINARNKINFDIENKNGKRYIVLADKDRNGEVQFKNGGICLENVMPDNPLLTDLATRILNENFDKVSKDFNPLISNSIGSFVDTIIRPILTENALEDLFE